MVNKDYQLAIIFQTTANKSFPFPVFVIVNYLTPNCSVYRDNGRWLASGETAESGGVIFTDDDRSETTSTGVDAETGRSDD